MPRYHIDDYQAHIDTELGISDWLEIDQARIDAFAAATNDHNPLHVDPAAAAEGPFGVTVAHGFLTLSLLSWFAYEVDVLPAGVAFGLNYGFDRVRLMNPVRVGQRVRARIHLVEVSERGEGRYVFRLRVRIEIENEARPALVANWLTLLSRS